MALWPLKEGLFPAYDRALRQRNRLLKEWDGPGTARRAWRRGTRSWSPPGSR